MLHAFLRNAKTSGSNWSNVTIAITTQGNFRVPIPAGNITYKQLVAMCPWENRLVSLTLLGQHIWDLLEDSVVPMNSSSSAPRSSRFLQVSGLRINYNLAAASGQRVVSVRVRCSNCEVPVYRPLKLAKTYRLVVMEYLANGKNGFNLISENAGHLEMGPFDLDSLMNYMRAVGPIIIGIEQRINFVNT